jgi:phytoene/squalene synthetase
MQDDFTSVFWAALKNSIDLFKLTPDNFSRLLTAFKSDIMFSGFETFQDILNYCSNSANPVGRIILEIFAIRDDKALYYSDKVCTALQLINFYQDVSIDIKQNRIYIPKDEMKQFSVASDDIREMRISENFRELLKLQISRVDSMFNEGRNILPYLPFRLKKDISWTILGGEKISQKIKRNNFNVLSFRPKIKSYEIGSILLKSFFI